MAETSELMKRPEEDDELTLKRAWEIIAPKVKSYLGQEWSDSEEPYIREQIMEVLSDGGDGYHMARVLERKGWEEDRYLVDLMDDASFALKSAHKELVMQWITAYGISPDRKVGDTVSTTHWSRKAYSWRLSGWRWAIAAILVCLGVGGMRSSFVQHRDSDKKQSDLTGAMQTLQNSADVLQATVNSYGPKLDALIANPRSPERIVGRQPYRPSAAPQDTRGTCLRCRTAHSRCKGLRSPSCLKPSNRRSIRAR